MNVKRINLLFIVNSLGFGGAEKHVVTLANTLDVSRFKLTLAYLKNEDDLLPQIDIDRIDGRVACCHVSKKVDLSAIRQLAQLIRDDEIDVVVCTNAFSLLYGWLARLFARIYPRLVVVFHTTELDSMKDKFQMLFYRPLFWISDMLVYVCENQRTHWESRGLWARRSTVIHNGIDTAYFADRFSPETKSELRIRYGFLPSDYLVGICALLRPEKAHIDLLRAISALRESGADVKCLLIGDGPMRAEIESEISNLGLASHVSITGFLTDVRPAIAACSVMTLVSHHVETFSIAALEAMALGKAMVMTEIGGANEQVVNGENGYLYARGDILALTRALRHLMESQRRDRMGTRASTRVAQQFSLGGMVDAYDQLFVGLKNDHH
jgi:glycosyltransferase involved in cell wall biosynthesis